MSDFSLEGFDFKKLEHLRHRSRSTDRSTARVPVCTDVRWPGWAAPLFEYLSSEPRSWQDLRQWSRVSNTGGFDLVRQCLAWLENEGEVRSFYREGTIRWTATRMRPKESGMLPTELTE